MTTSGQARRLEGRRAIVTGAARGIGLACVQRLVDDGASVLLVDIEADAGEAAAAAFAAAGAHVAFHEADLARPDQAEAVVAAAERALGGVEILVNNAGIAPRANFFDLTTEDYDRVLAINLRAPMLLTQAMARRLRARGAGGAVVNLSSINAVLNCPASSAYFSSKG